MFSLKKAAESPAGNVLIAFVLLQIIAIVASLMFYDTFRYVSAINISLLLKSMAVIGVMAVGVGVLMVSGEFDLSVGSAMTFIAIVMSTLVQDGWNVWACMALALALGALIGMANGYISLTFGIPSFITTLGGLLFFRGAVLIYHGPTQLRFEPTPLFKNVFAGDFLIFDVKVSMLFVWFIIVAIIFGLILHKHRLGNHIYAVGGDQGAAHAIGVNVFRTKMIAFMICGVCAAFAGVLSTTRVLSVQPGQGAGMELQAIAACVIGGFALKGGRGAVLGAVLGAAFIYTLSDILILLRLPGYYLDTAIGIFLVAAVIVNQKLDQDSNL
jgi:simple sugar transport system permease protein